MNHSIGLDAHGKSCTFVVLNSKGAEVLTHRVETSEFQLKRFVRSIPGKKSLTFEECHLSKWLYTVLKPEVDELIVCNPAFVVKRSGTKDDAQDAKHLAQLLRGGFLTPVYHEESFFSELRSVVSSYHDLCQDLVRSKNRYKALFRSEAHQVAGSTIYIRRERIQELSHDTDRFVAEGLFDQIQMLTQNKDRYIKRMESYTERHPEIKALTSLPGISHIRANIIASVVCSPKRFANKHKFWSYCMLVRHDQQSDGVSYGKIKKIARADLKEVFIGAAQSALRGDSALRLYYDEMRAKGLDHSAARKNVARKIAAISLALMRTKQSYREDSIQLTHNKTQENCKKNVATQV